MDICGIFPSVVLHAVAFPFDEELQSSAEHLTVQYFFDQVFLFSFYELGWRWRFQVTTFNWIVWCGS